MSKKVFEDLIAQAGIPSNADSMDAQFQQVADDNDILFNNSSDFSPFWRLIRLLVITPTLWLIDLIKDSILPNMFVKTATGAWLDLLAAGVDITRKQATKVKGEITFTRVTNSGALSIPSGTVIQTPKINEAVYELMVIDDTPFIEGNYTLDVVVQAPEAGSAWNFGEGFYSILPDAISGVTVSNGSNWLTQPGTDLENDDDLRERTKNQFSAINQYHTDAVYRAIISKHIGVEANQIYFDHGAPRGAGSATAFILFDAGVPTQDYIDSINLHIRDEGNHGHGDDLLCAAMPETLHNIGVDIWLRPNISTQDITDLKQQITFFIQTAFREATNTDYKPTQTMPWARFSFSRLGQELHKQFAEIESLNFSNNDIVSEMSIPRLNLVLVNMNG